MFLFYWCFSNLYFSDSCSVFSVRCGTNFNDLQEIEVAKLSEPSGWVKIPLKDLNDRLVRTFMVQVELADKTETSFTYRGGL
jgi:hypothetical protein